MAKRPSTKTTKKSAEPAAKPAKAKPRRAPAASDDPPPARAKAAAEALPRATKGASRPAKASPSSDGDAPPASSEPSSGRARRGARKDATPAAPARVRPEYSLDGPVPPEGASLPRKVGALLGVGQQALGIKGFRPGQAEAFDHLLRGEDLLAVMPTGSGKSLLYQLTSMVVPGVTVVVSPLIALIKDQLDKMQAKGVAAAKIDSTLTVRQRREVDELVRAPGGKLLLTTPERMADPEFRVYLREACGGVGVSRFVVDEAHCVSQWGHDFRPAYLSLRKALEDVGRPPVLATTATAPPHVRDDILFQLGMEKATIVTTTFDRPNLHYEVIIFHDEDEKMRTLVTLLKKLPRPGIVYCATVKKVEELYESLTRWGVPTAKYHGRMNKGERDDSQQRFMESSELVMVATNAFGLGVDKPNVRNVLHYHVPGSLEAYAQEAGRGGRDGKPARCVLLFSPDDVAIQEYFLSGTYPTKRQVKMVFDALSAFTGVSGRLAEESPPTVANIALGSGVGQQRTRTVLSLLKDEGFVTEQEGGLFRVADPPPEMDDLMDRARQYEARRIADRQRLDALLTYVKAPGCRNQVILEYLGEPQPPTCGRCDNCLRSREAALAASSEASRLGASLTRVLDADATESAPAPQPRREIKARVVRIDPQQPNAAAAAAATALAPSAGADAARPSTPASTPSTVLRRSHKPTAAPVTEAPPRAPVPAAAAAPTPGTPAAGQQARPTDRPAAATAAPGGVVARRPQPAPSAPPDEDYLEDEDEDEDDEIEVDEHGNPIAASDDEDDDDLDDEDDDDLDDEDDDDLDDEDDDDLDDEDDDDLDDEDDDDLDDEDDEDDEDDYEVIEKTAAELAEEGLEGPGEITVLARKRQPKQPKQRPQRVTDDGPSASAAEARRRRRRRRRKRRAMLPPKSAFVTPVLSTAAPIAEAQPRRPGAGGGGPVIEYVRGPMRIATAPVASANPNDAGVPRRRGKKQRRWEHGGGFRDGQRRGDQRGRGGPGGGGQPWQAQPGSGGPPRPPGPDGVRPERRRRRRRRRRRGGENGGLAMTGPVPGGGLERGGDASSSPSGSGDRGPSGQPVSFFQPTAGGQGPMLGPDGQPLRKRRRRRRRGRGGRNREWRMNGGGADGGGGGPPAGGGGGGASDGGAG